MRILPLTEAVEKRLLSARRHRDITAERIAARIISDVRRRGDSALFGWAKKLDGVELTRESVWISRDEMRAAARTASPELFRAVKHAARNVRRVAEKQLPQSWRLTVEPGVHIGQIV